MMNSGMFYGIMVDGWIFYAHRPERFFPLIRSRIYHFLG